MTNATATKQSLCSITHKGQPVEMSKATHIFLDEYFRDWLDDDYNRNHYIANSFINPHFEMIVENGEDEVPSKEIYQEVMKLDESTGGDIQVSWDFALYN